MKHIIPREKKCKICGKEFIPQIDEIWAYKKKDKYGNPVYFCSWHCLREQERRTEKPKQKHSALVIKIWELLGEGVPPYLVAVKLGITYDKVKYWKERYTG